LAGYGIFTAHATSVPGLMAAQPGARHARLYWRRLSHIAWSKKVRSGQVQKIRQVNTSKAFFKNPQYERLRSFLSNIDEAHE
jgi:hypothetical protein